MTGAASSLLAQLAMQLSRRLEAWWGLALFGSGVLDCWEGERGYQAQLVSMLTPVDNPQQNTQSSLT